MYKSDNKRSTSTTVKKTVQKTTKKKTKKEPTNKELAEWCTTLGRKPPSGYNKPHLYQLYDGLIAMGATVDDPLPPYPSYKYDYTCQWTDTNLTPKEHLEQYGWCTIPITTLVPEEIRDLFFDWLERADARFDRGQPQTYKHIPVNVRGIFKGLIGQSELMWTVREGCYRAFVDLWDGEEDLVTSLDGACFLTKRNRMEQWIHSDTIRDHTGEDNHMYTYQGLYNILPCGEHDGGLLLLEGSHKIYNEYLKGHPIDCIKGYTHIDMNDELLLPLPLVKVCCNAGDLVIWDGRTFHCNTPPTTDDGLRMCCYVSMQPGSLLTDREIAYRKTVYEEGKQTGHWCYGPSLTVDSYRTYGKDVPDVEIATLNEMQSYLLG